MQPERDPENILTGIFSLDVQKLQFRMHGCYSCYEPEVFIYNVTKSISRRVDNGKWFNATDFCFLIGKIRMSDLFPWHKYIGHLFLLGILQELSLSILPFFSGEPPCGSTEAISSIMKISPVHKIPRFSFCCRRSFNSCDLVIFLGDKLIYHFI